MKLFKNVFPDKMFFLNDDKKNDGTFSYKFYLVLKFLIKLYQIKYSIH